ncbi:MAG: CRISPR-associated protein [Candidatus Tectimicrobiota bacterium]|nr:MAG: CRISPR-associated protein [Candidatus Tectomicrobia bacterium]
MRIEGCRIELLDHSACTAWLDHVLGRAPAPADLGDPAWLLCHSDDGVTWGHRDGGVWRLASAFFPEPCPVPSEIRVQEMRVFSSKAEVLIWRTDNGLRGRMLVDDDHGQVEDSLRPDDEERLLLSGQVHDERDGFTCVSDGGGGMQVLPLRVPKRDSSRWPRLRVRHYFAREENTGSIRVVATRLVEVK